MIEWFIPKWLKVIRKCDFRINTVAGRKGANRKRRKQYSRLYKKAEKVILHLRAELKKHTYAAAVLRPSVEVRLLMNL